MKKRIYKYRTVFLKNIDQDYYCILIKRKNQNFAPLCTHGFPIVFCNKAEAENYARKCLRITFTIVNYCKPGTVTLCTGVTIDFFEIIDSTLFCSKNADVLGIYDINIDVANDEIEIYFIHAELSFIYYINSKTLVYKPDDTQRRSIEEMVIISDLMIELKAALTDCEG